MIKATITLTYDHEPGPEFVDALRSLMTTAGALNFELTRSEENGPIAEKKGGAEQKTRTATTIEKEKVKTCTTEGCDNPLAKTNVSGLCRSCAVKKGTRKYHKQKKAKKGAHKYCSTHHRQMPCEVCEAPKTDVCRNTDCDNPIRRDNKTGLCRSCDMEAKTRAPELGETDLGNDYECQSPGCTNLRFHKDDTGFCDECKRVGSPPDLLEDVVSGIKDGKAS